MPRSMPVSESHDQHLSRSEYSKLAARTGASAEQDDDKDGNATNPWNEALVVYASESLVR